MEKHFFSEVSLVSRSCMWFLTTQWTFPWKKVVTPLLCWQQVFCLQFFFFSCGIVIILCYCFRYSSDDPDILEWDENSWRDSDWVEQTKCKQALGWDDSGDPAEFIYLENPDLQQYRWVRAWPLISVTCDCFSILVLNSHSDLGVCRCIQRKWKICLSLMLFLSCTWWKIILSICSQRQLNPLLGLPNCTVNPLNEYPSSFCLVNYNSDGSLKWQLNQKCL